jgi:hypothetical protein
MDKWEKLDPDKLYLIVTVYDRMIKHLQQDETDTDILWGISTNHPRIKIIKNDISNIYRVVWAGRLV